MFSSVKLVAIAALLLTPLDALAERVYRRQGDDDPQTSLSKCDESQHLPALVLISSLYQNSTPRSFNPLASSLVWKAVGTPARLPH